MLQLTFGTWIRVATACAVLAIAAAGGALLIVQAQAPDDSLLEGVPVDELKTAGITVTPSRASTTAVSADQAAKAVVESGIDMPVKEIVLARVADSSKVPPVDRDLWIVNLDVTGQRIAAFGPPGSPDSAALIYYLVFVDPDTGKPLYSTSAAKTD